MHSTSLQSRTRRHRALRHPWLLRSTCTAALWLIAGSAHAASIYQCIGAHGEKTFRDTPCAGQTRQTKLEVAGLPLIDHGAPRWNPPASSSGSPARHSRTRNTSEARARKAKPATSWECRAANGEVFYRHARCPGSVQGDGVVRNAYAEKHASGRTRGHDNAWSKVPVHGTKISRAEACRRIRSPSAAGRDGHLRDKTVGTYDHLMGRDACSGA